MLKRSTLLAALAFAAPLAAEAKPWSRTYVAEWLEPAFYYPGVAGGEAAPGKDCPNGANPAVNKRTALKTSYRTWEEVDKLLDPENPQWTRNGGIRGPNQENVYEQPWVVPDTGTMAPVAVDSAHGFDLDGNPKTGLKGVNGGAGIDNKYFQMAGCWLNYRGVAGTLAKYANEYMQQGRFSILMIVSGTGDDPDNDPNVKVAFHMSNDGMVAGATAEILSGYTFRVVTDPRFQSLADARTVNGAIESKTPTTLQLHDHLNAGFFPPQLQLLRGQFRFGPSGEDGRITGMIGGYRSIDEYYTGWAAAGSTHESVTRIDIPAMWYALQRNADYKMSPQSENNDAISTAYRLYWVPAHAVEPDASAEITEAKLFPGPIDPKLSRQGRPVFPSGERRSGIATVPAETPASSGK